MKIKFSVRSVTCERKIDIVQRDSVFFYAYAVAGKWNADRTDVEGKVVGKPIVSAVRKGVRRGTQWSFSDTLVVNVPTDAEAVAIKYALYEKDKGDILKKLGSAAKVIQTTPIKATDLIDDLGELAKAAVGFDLSEILAVLADGLFEKLRALRGDDLIGTDELAFSLDDPSFLDDGSIDESFQFRGTGDLGKRSKYHGKVVCERVD